MVDVTSHRFADEAAFLAACEAVGWTRGPEGQPLAAAGYDLDVIGPWVARPTLVAGKPMPGAIDPRWHVNLARLEGLPLPAEFLPSMLDPATPGRGFALPPARAPEAAAVPGSVAAWKCKAMLRRAHLLAPVAAAVAGGSVEMQDAWTGAAEWDRRGDFVVTLAATMGLSEAVVDQLFRDADAIRG